MMISEKEMCSVINKRKEKKMMGVDKLIYDELAFFYFSSFEQRLYPLYIYILLHFILQLIPCFTRFIEFKIEQCTLIFYIVCNIGFFNIRCYFFFWMEKHVWRLTAK